MERQQQMAVAVFGTKASALVPYALRHSAIELLGLINWFMEANHMISYSNTILDLNKNSIDYIYYR